jgi:hypothetical protein
MRFAAQGFALAGTAAADTERLLSTLTVVAASVKAIQEGAVRAGANGLVQQGKLDAAETEGRFDAGRADVRA